MTDTSLSLPRGGTLSFGTRVQVVRASIIVGILAIWEVMARSGLLFQDVVPPLGRILSALVSLVVDPIFYSNLWVTALEVAGAVAIGTTLGTAVGVVLGSSRLLSRAYEPFLFYLGPTPKIVFFPLLIMWFGVGPGSKVALGALSAFFPFAIATAAAVRSVPAIFLRVGMSFKLTRRQMLQKVYLPAIRAPLMNGFRLGMGIAIIGTVLAETKLSNQGIGYLIIQTYTTFNMPRMYALLLVLFAIAIVLNAFLTRLAARYEA